MKYLILLALVAFVSSSVSREARKLADAEEYVKIPDGFGGLKFASVEDTEEISPAFDAARDVRFLVFTRFNPTIGQQVVFDNMDTVRSTNFSADRPTRVLIHGWQSDATSDLNILTTGGYLRSYDVNVVVVDWGLGANTINYISSRNRVNPVGAVLAEFLDNLEASGLIRDFNRLALVGHSLGAHIAGAAGKRVRNGLINTIVGLDPAGPLFDADNPGNRLAETDAHYVEVVHTDTSSFGIGAAIGDVDFYPNGGTNQPGCWTQICDHNIVIQFFVESLNSDRLWGRRCANMDVMLQNSCTGPGAPMGGEPSNYGNGLTGIFRFGTNSNSPFGVGQV